MPVDAGRRRGLGRTPAMTSGPWPTIRPSSDRKPRTSAEPLDGAALPRTAGVSAAESGRRPPSEGARPVAEAAGDAVRSGGAEGSSRLIWSRASTRLWPACSADTGRRRPRAPGRGWPRQSTACRARAGRSRGRRRPSVQARYGCAGAGRGSAARPHPAGRP